MPDQSRVAVHIVTWNSLTHISACLEAVTQQRFQPLNVMVVDNGSVDGTVKWMEEHYPQLHLLRNTRNLGFCRAHNQAIRLTAAEYILVLNPDVILEKDWVQRGVSFLDQHPEFGSFGGKLRRFTYSPDELKEVVTSDIVDSAGLRVFRSRHTIDRGSGESDHGQFDQAQEVFGHSGACCLFRRAALETVRWHDQYFDEDFFAYKDDLDLAWRLQRLGWKSWYDPKAVAFHHRHIQGQSAVSDILIARNHSSRDRFNSYYSYRNHWLTLLKNERWSTLWRDGLWMMWYEGKKFFYLLFSHPSSLRGLTSAWRLWPLMARKARLLDHHAKIIPNQVRQTFFLSS